MCRLYKEKSIITKDINISIQKTSSDLTVKAQSNSRLTGAVSMAADISLVTNIKENSPPDYIRRVNALKKLRREG